jgi:hypothetical protein
VLVLQVRNWRDVGPACFDGADGAERQALAHSTALGVALVRRRGGRWVITVTPETMAWLLHAARVVTVVPSPRERRRENGLSAVQAEPRAESTDRAHHTVLHLPLWWKL